MSVRPQFPSGEAWRPRKRTGPAQLHKALSPFPNTPTDIRQSAMLFASYAIYLPLLALLGPMLLRRYGRTPFIVFVILVSLAVAFAIDSTPLSAAFWASNPGEASAGLVAVVVGFGMPIWGSA